MFYIIKKMSWFIKKEWLMYALLLIILLLISFLSLMPAYVLGLAIDKIVSATMTVETLMFYTSLMVGIPILRYTMSYLYNILVSIQAQKLTFELRERYLKKLYEMDIDFYEKYTKGDLISRATEHLENITVAATTLLEGIVFNVGVILIAIGIMATTIHLNLTIIAVSIMPIGLTILNMIRQQKRKYIKIHQEIYAQMTEKVLESTEGQKTIRAYGQEEKDLKQLNETILKDIESWRYIVKYENWFNPLFEVVYGISYVLAFVFGAYFIFKQQMTLGGLVTFVSYIGQLYGPIIAISTIFTQLNNAIISLDRYEEVMDAKTLVKDEVDSKTIMTFDEITFRNVTYRYPFDKEPTLHNINLTIKKGQTIGIVGPTGSGKSTLIRQLLREFNPTSGDIEIDGISIKNYKIEDVRTLVGYVPQEHTLFRKGVDQNIMMGNPKASLDDLKQAIQMADFEKDLSFLNQGIHTLVGESGVTLSGGQKQRLSIARALVKQPEILILDDSLSAVDAKTEENILTQLSSYRSDKTNLIVTHRFSAVRKADLIIVLDQGQIVQMGTHLELLNQEGWYQTQYNLQTSMES